MKKVVKNASFALSIFGTFLGIALMMSDAFSLNIEASPGEITNSINWLWWIGGGLIVIGLISSIYWLFLFMNKK